MQRPVQLFHSLRRWSRQVAALALLLYLVPLAMPCGLLLAGAVTQPACHAKLPARQATHCLGQLLAACADGSFAQDARDFSVAKFTPAIVTMSLISVAPVPMRPLASARLDNRAPPDTLNLLLRNCVFLL